MTPDRSGNGFNNIANAKNWDGKSKYYGRFNIGVSTVNLAYIGLKTYNDFRNNTRTQNIENMFFKELDAACELCHKAQQVRADRLSHTKAEVAPILWCDGALARLKPDDSLERLIHNGYCTSSLGYAGLYECVKVMTGESHTQSYGKQFGLKIMQFLNDKCAEWKAAENIDYSVYGSPIESTTYKFAKALKNRFGIIKGITDRDYISNSYHIPVFEKINAFDKLLIESEFQQLSPGGAISYVELPDMKKNIPAVIELIKFIYDNIMYAELNLHIDYCMVCGYDGDIQIDDNLDWYCPNCGNRDQDKMNVTRRTCGYLGTNFWNKGRTQEIKERVYHLGYE